MGHGFLGAAGGAFAGHKLEDTWKHHNQEKKQEEEQKKQHEHQQPMPQYGGPPPPYSGPGHAAGPPANMRGNFSASAQQISLDGDYDLIARCRAIDGNEKLSALNLNKVLGNDNGRFVWTEDGGNFGASARNVRLLENGRVLEAELKDVNGGWHWSRVWLDERVGNNNGDLVLA
jgi:hypothetical protein